MTPPPQREPWHFKREIQIGHLITTVTVMASVLVYATKIEQRVALLEQSRLEQKERDERQDRAANDGLSAINAHLSKIDDKLDKILFEKRARWGARN